MWAVALSDYTGFGPNIAVRHIMQRVIRDTGRPIVSNQGAIAPLIAVAAWPDEWDECEADGVSMLQDTGPWVASGYEREDA